MQSRFETSNATVEEYKCTHQLAKSIETACSAHEIHSFFSSANVSEHYHLFLLELRFPAEEVQQNSSHQSQQAGLEAEENKVADSEMRFGKESYSRLY